MEIIPGIYHVPESSVGIFLIAEPDQLTLVDTGFATDTEPVARLIAAVGRQPSDVRRIILTHRHPDHIGGAAALKKLTGAQVYAPEPDARAIADDPSQSFPVAPIGTLMRLFAGKKLTPPPCQVDVILKHNDELPIMGGLRVIGTPGHTKGHISLFHPTRRILLAGDAVTTFGGRVRGSLPFLCDDYRQHCRTIRDLLAPLEIDAVLAGHGKPIREGAAPHFAALARKYTHM